MLRQTCRLPDRHRPPSLRHQRRLQRACGRALPSSMRQPRAAPSVSFCRAAPLLSPSNATAPAAARSCFRPTLRRRLPRRLRFPPCRRQSHRPRRRCSHPPHRHCRHCRRRLYLCRPRHRQHRPPHRLLSRPLLRRNPLLNAPTTATPPRSTRLPRAPASSASSPASRPCSSGATAPAAAARRLHYRPHCPSRLPSRAYRPFRLLIHHHRPHRPGRLAIPGHRRRRRRCRRLHSCHPQALPRSRCYLETAAAAVASDRPSQARSAASRQHSLARQGWRRTAAAESGVRVPRRHTRSASRHLA